MFEISIIRGAESHQAQSTEPEKLSFPSAFPKHGNRFSRLRDYAFMATMVMAQFMSLAGLAQSVSPLLVIGEDFNTHDSGYLSWFTAAYSLTVGTFILPAGRMGDMFGHKKLYLVGWVWFSVWSVVVGCSVWGGSVMFSVSRGFQGIGPAILVPNAMALVGRTYPLGLKRNLVFSAFGAGGPTGFVVGATFAALFSQLTWWPWTFWAMAIACAAMAVIVLVIVPPDSARQRPHGTEKPTFDYLGSFTGIGGLVLFNFAWNQGAVVGWQVPYTYVIMIIGMLFMIAFFIVETRFARYPLVPVRGLKKEAAYTLACIAAGWASHGIWIYYIFWFLGLLRGHTPLSQAAQTSPVAVVGVAFAFLAGFLMTKIRPAYVMLVAMSLFLAGSILIATAPVDQTYWIQTFLSVLIMPGGMNLSFPAGTILLSNALPKENQGIAASLVSVSVNYSISIGLGFAGTIDRYVSPQGDGSYDYLRGFRGAWWFGAGLDGLGLLIALYFVWHTRSKNSKIPSAWMHLKQPRLRRLEHEREQMMSLDTRQMEVKP